MTSRPVSRRTSFICLVAFGVGLQLSACSGCAVFTPPTAPELILPPLPNPICVRTKDPYLVWETVVDVVDDYFDIEFEEPVRVMDGLLTEGRLDTYPRIGATIFEPWRKDSVGRYERLHATLQSVRRRARVQVAPSPQGFRIEVAVVKELEDVPPGDGSGSPASFRNDTSLVRVVGAPGDPPREAGWLPLGRDLLLEQRILHELAARLGYVASGPGGAPGAGLPGSTLPDPLVSPPAS